jgi:hypothetical protein
VAVMAVWLLLSVDLQPRLASPAPFQKFIAALLSDLAEQVYLR